MTDPYSVETTPKLNCYNHPQRETMLRCNRCERPICSECAVLTPTGYRCKECIRGQQKTFDTSRPLDLPLAHHDRVAAHPAGPHRPPTATAG